MSSPAASASSITKGVVDAAGCQRARLKKAVKEWSRCDTLKLGDALDIFQRLIDTDPPPPIYSFNTILIGISRMKQFAASVSLFNMMNRTGGISQTLTLSASSSIVVAECVA
ncbi:hypothetical protein HPP92_025978 [Vanilla planifolia]|uniref:Pentatricopeptide repeat-containing protein n=1 Tax=Vanilla planifolia TaxID=51239 RepID=A0A835PHY7_VANPL|nr:hypothetical protein HPP92_026247 [Vanilla planifolia]KAG0451967.1 hypothetical protein HPP92_025978 [Vanilla planifolia]